MACLAPQHPRPRCSRPRPAPSPALRVDRPIDPSPADLSLTLPKPGHGAKTPCLPITHILGGGVGWWWGCVHRTAEVGFQGRCEIFSESQVAMGLAALGGKVELESILFPPQTSQVQPWEASQDSLRGPGRLGWAAQTPPSLGSSTRSHTLRRRSPPSCLPARPLLLSLPHPHILAFYFFHGMSTGGLVDATTAKGPRCE